MCSIRTVQCWVQQPLSTTATKRPAQPRALLVRKRPETPKKRPSWPDKEKSPAARAGPRTSGLIQGSCIDMRYMYCTCLQTRASPSPRLCDLSVSTSFDTRIVAGDTRVVAQNHRIPTERQRDIGGGLGLNWRRSQRQPKRVGCSLGAAQL